MMVMTAKVNFKKTLTLVGILAGLIVAVILLFGGSNSAETSAPTVSGNDARVQFLKDLGWDAAASPVEANQVKIPDQTTEVFDRYNALQKSQGYDLTQYAGKSVMRFVYKINNYPGATEPVYATLLVYKNRIIGGDVTDTAAKGRIQGLKISKDTPNTTPSTSSETTSPTESTAATESAGAA